jgi:hypothetical protein
MQVTGSWTIFLFGCGGGACIELLRWWKVRESENFPDYASRPAYWILTFAMIIAGGVLAVVYGAGPTNAIQAMNIGAAAPAIIGTISAPPKGGADSKSFSGQARTRRRLREFLAFS